MSEYEYIIVRPYDDRTAIVWKFPNRPQEQVCYDEILLDCSDNEIRQWIKQIRNLNEADTQAVRINL